MCFLISKGNNNKIKQKLPETADGKPKFCSLHPNNKCLERGLWRGNVSTARLWVYSLHIFVSRSSFQQDTREASLPPAHPINIIIVCVCVYLYSF